MNTKCKEIYVPSKGEALTECDVWKWYQNIEKEFPYKLKAFKMYKSEVMKFPHPCSIKAIENLAIQSGVECSLKKAEAFQLIRNVVD